MTATKRQFYRTEIRVVVLSEEPFHLGSLADVGYAITEGDCVGDVDVIKSETLDGPAAASALAALGSEAGFFQLTPEGADIGEDDEGTDGCRYPLTLSHDDNIIWIDHLTSWIKEFGEQLPEMVYRQALIDLCQGLELDTLAIQIRVADDAELPALLKELQDAIEEADCNELEETFLGVFDIDVHYEGSDRWTLHSSRGNYTYQG